MPGSYPATKTVTPPSSAFYPAYSIIGCSVSMSGGGIVIPLAATCYWSPYKAVTLYMMTIFVTTTNGVGCTVSFQPYGSPSAGNGNLYGTAKSVVVPATNNAPVQYNVAQSLVINAGGYIGVGATPTSNVASTLSVDAILWATQAAQ